MRIPVRVRALGAALSLVLALVGLGGLQLERSGQPNASAAAVLTSAHPGAAPSQLAAAPHQARAFHPRLGLDIGTARPVPSSATDRPITEVASEPSVVLVAIKYAVSERAPPVVDAV